MKKITKIQQMLLEHLQEMKTWTSQSSWGYVCTSQTKRIFQALEKKGCVYSGRLSHGTIYYRITPLGQEMCMTKPYIFGEGR